MGQQQGEEEFKEEEEGVGGKDDDKNDFDGKELASELLRIISSDFSLNELAFVPPWKHLRELLGEKFADGEEDQNDRKQKSRLFYRSFCVREHKLAINAHVIVPVLNYVYSQLRRKKDEKNDDDAFLDDDLKVLLCVLTGDSLSGWNVRKRRVLEALEKDGDKTSDDEEKNRMKEMEREMMFATFVQTKFPKSTAAFAHRRWVIMTCCFHGGGAERRNHLITRNARRDTTMLSLLLLHNVYERETLACEQTCRRKLSNYAAWSHKLFVFELVHVKQNVNEPDGRRASCENQKRTFLPPIRARGIFDAQ